MDLRTPDDSAAHEKEVQGFLGRIRVRFDRSAAIPHSWAGRPNIVKMSGFSCRRPLFHVIIHYITKAEPLKSEWRGGLASLCLAKICV